MRIENVGRKLLITLIVVALAAGLGTWSFRHLGRWLVRTDQLQHATAIVVLSGVTPFRAMEAAEIYRQGWAPEVWLERDTTDESDTQFAKLGILHPNEQYYDQQVLEHMGVPKEAIRILEPPTTNTVSEIERIADELRSRNSDKVILVTSPFHTRRTRLIWKLAVGEKPEVIVRLASSEPIDPDHWWRATQDVQYVLHEVLGIIDARLGFISKPRQEPHEALQHH